MVTRYGWGEMSGYLRTLEQDRQDVLSMTPDVLQQAARSVFAAGNLKIAVVGPWKETQRRAVKEILRQYELSCTGNF